MLTTRDFEVVEFVREFKIADTATIRKLFFSSDDVCWRRLKAISDAGKLSRARDSVSSQYIYFAKCPKQVRHALLVSRFYAALAGAANVPRFAIEPDCGHIRPDAAFVYDAGSGPCVGLLEVEISNKGFDAGKYQRFIESGDYKEYMTARPKVFVVSSKPVPDGFIHIDTSLKKIRVE
ncbi:hypothetical protein [Pygmaiobacter massiliensis]|uniref:hypothetical protein n=1 Tax=Pygmaiobacter massiliensis TaxID=1917873 RepID=UPI000C7C50AD|nr:hypothetical protein [Pygmaiobacter massiliensis]